MEVVVLTIKTHTYEPGKDDLLRVYKDEDAAIKGALSVIKANCFCHGMSRDQQKEVMDQARDRLNAIGEFSDAYAKYKITSKKIEEHSEVLRQVEDEQILEQYGGSDMIMYLADERGVIDKMAPRAKAVTHWRADGAVFEKAKYISMEAYMNQHFPLFFRVLYNDASYQAIPVCESSTYVAFALNPTAGD